MTLVQIVVRDHGSEKLCRNEPSPVMKKLVEGVLTIGAGLSPNHGARCLADLIALAVDPLSIALHVGLLQISWQSGQSLIVRENRHGLGTKNARVPHLQESHEDRDILFEGSVSEVVISRAGALQQALEPMTANGQRDRKTNGTPQ